MRKTLFFGTVIALAVGASAAAAATLDDIKARGTLKCGVNTGFAGFAFPDADGRWQGFDVLLCRAIAAAVLGDQDKIEFVPTTGETRFTALTSGEIDVLSRNSTWTFTRDVDLKFTWAGVNYYDGQGFMVSKDLGVTSALELDGATICVQTGTTTELNLADFFKVNNISYQPVPIQTASGPIVSIPYTVEMNDISMMALQHHASEEWLRRGIDHFDRLYLDGEKSARVMAISIHPYISGAPHRIGYVERLYEYIRQRPGVQLWTGEQILDWYRSVR